MKSQSSSLLIISLFVTNVKSFYQSNAIPVNNAI